MKNLNTYIQENTCVNEKLTIVHKPSVYDYVYAPETKEELKEIIEKRLKQDPNAD